MLPSQPKPSSLLLITQRKKELHLREAVVRQADIEEVLALRRRLMESETKIGVALSGGASVEPGVHAAELVPEFRGNGYRELVMKLVIICLLLVAPFIYAQNGLLRDLNGDGKIDFADFSLGLIIASDCVSSSRKRAYACKPEAPSSTLSIPSLSEVLL